MSLRDKIVQLQSEIDALRAQISATETSSKAVDDSHKATLELKSTEYAAEIERIKSEHTIEIKSRDSKVESLTQDLETKQDELDERELKKLASAYQTQESECKKDIVFWQKCLFYAGAIFAVSAAASVIFSGGHIWYEKFEFYLADVVLFSAVWFCSSQFADCVKLKNDYANRKTLAQSFHNIFNNLPEDEAIRDKFIEKATDVLCAPVIVGTKEPVLSKKVVKDVAAIVGAVAGK